MNTLRGSILDLQARLSHLEFRLERLESEHGLGKQDPDLRERSKSRWRRAPPNSALTWGKIVTGEDFVTKVAGHGAFGPGKTILEMGPGYGRLLGSILEKRLQFGSYLGIDLSETNVKFLRSTFESPRISFAVADAENCELNIKFDLFISSLTMKHLHPTFESALTNLLRFSTLGCVIFFDLIEGEGQYFEDDGVTYIRHYSKDEASSILHNLGLETVSFDYVHHDAEHTRLLVIAEQRI